MRVRLQYQCEIARVVWLSCRYRARVSARSDGSGDTRSSELNEQARDDMLFE